MESAKIIMFFPKYVYASVDIVGKITVDGTYEQIICGMNDVYYLDEMRELVERINYDNYGQCYSQNTYSLTNQFAYDDLLDMKSNYEKQYGTTWLFIKNMSGRSLEIIGADGTKYNLRNRRLGSLYCGIPSCYSMDEFAEITNVA